MSRARKNNNIYHPKYWAIWLLMGLLKLIAYLPYTVLMHIGKALGMTLCACPLKIKKTTQVNLKLCFPELSDQAREDLLKKNFLSLGMGIMETALAWFASAKKIAHLAHVNGAQQIEIALSRGKGALLISPHLTSLQIAGRLWALQKPFAVVYRPQKNPVFNYVTERSLRKHYAHTIARGNVREILRCLNQNIPVWYTPDIDAGLRNSIFVPFFSVSAATITATTRLAKASDTAVIPTFFYRREDLSGYELTGEPILENFPTEDVAADTARINQVLEDGIRRAPEQYIWQYKRFKTRPKGEKRFY
jgi:KDO2-lipid IV(A) lauroyltransferase